MLTKYMILFGIISTAIVFLSCSNEIEFSEHIHISEGLSSGNPGWDDIFTNENVIQLELPSDKSDLLRIVHLSVNGNGNIFIPEPHERQIYVFNEHGKFLFSIGSEGKGPGEFMIIGHISFDVDDNLWVYDPTQMRISIFSYPEYKFYNSFTIKTRISRFIVDNDMNMIAYSLHSDYLVNKFNKNGELISRTFTTTDRTFKTFLARFQDGGITHTHSNDGFYFIYPQNYIFYLYKYDLEPVLAIASPNVSKFRRDVPSFPTKLSAYDYTDEHMNWWYSFPHIYGIFTIDPDLVLIPIYTQYARDKWRFHINMYTIDGIIIAEGLELPHNGMLVGTHENKIYIVSNAELIDDGVITPLYLRTYTVSSNYSEIVK